MRVISGKYRGKKIEGYDINGTRPTMDRVKESLFAIIQNKIIDSICLDLFAGSGALGIEALSCGARECDFVDNNPLTIKALKKNLNNIENANIFNMDYQKYLNGTQKQFDIIFLDPPYSLNLITEAIKKIIENNLLKEEGLIICEYETEKIITSLKIIKEKKYGSKNIMILKK